MHNAKIGILFFLLLLSSTAKADEVIVKEGGAIMWHPAIQPPPALESTTCWVGGAPCPKHAEEKSKAKKKPAAEKSK